MEMTDTNIKMQELHLELKKYDGALLILKERVNMDNRGIINMFTATTVTERRLKFMKIAAQVLVEFKQQESEALQFVNSILA